MGGLAEAVEGVGRELGAECDHERVEAQRAAARLDPTAGRIDGPDLRLEELDPRRQEAPQRARDPLRSATSDDSEGAADRLVGLEIWSLDLAG